MPLIIITGTPCSGKTYRAKQIAEEFSSRIASNLDDSKRSVLYIPSNHASSDPMESHAPYNKPPPRSENPRDAIYDSARLEKTARAEELSAAKRAVNKNAVVIFDAPNYIKGFRYQLHCEAKAAGTRSVVVHTAARKDECVAWNNVRLHAWGWASEAGNELDVEDAKTNNSGPRIGKDVLGDLQPESHTALYGDAVANGGPPPRSSSVGAAVSDDETGEETQERQKDDTMTLKSLYISDKNQVSTASAHDQAGTLNAIQEQASLTTPSPAYPLPSSDPPSPKASLPYSPNSHKSLFMRYEPPSPFTRWDTPLFTIPSADPHPPYNAIWSAIFPTAAKPTSKKALLQQRQESQRAQKQAQETQAITPVPPRQPTTTTLNSTQPPKDQLPLLDPVRQNAATILPTATTPNALQLLESTTGEIVKLVLSSARTANAADGDGGTVTFSVPLPDVEGSTLELELEIPEGTSLSQPALQRLRRKYTQIQRGGIAHGQGYTRGRRGVAEGFVGFLQADFEGVV